MRSRAVSLPRACCWSMRFWPPLASPWLFPTSAAAAGFLAFAVRSILRDRQQLYGHRLAAVGLVLAALPWLAWLLRLTGLAKLD